MLYKGFISYSHAADDRLAPALQAALHRFAKPWYRLRAMRIFRDKTSLSANPALWLTIEKALEESEWLLLMASPQAARSQWVGQEIGWWLQHRSAERMLILLTDGELAWDPAAADFDWPRTSALPKTLQGHFGGEPLYVDLRWTKGVEALSLRHSQFRGAVLDIAAPLLGRAKDELDGEDVRQHRRTRRVAWGAAAALLALTLSSVTAAWLAIQQSRIARSRELATSATAQLSADPELSVLLAAEGARISPTAQSELALRRALLESHVRAAMRGHTAGVWSVAVSPDGKRVATAGDDQTVRVWDAATGASLAVLPGHTGSVTSVAFSGDGRFLVSASEDGSARLWDVQAAKSVARFENHLGLVHMSSFSPDSRRLIVARGSDAVIWDVIGRRTIRELRGHSSAVNAVAFSPDGKVILTGSDDGTARVWDAAKDTPVAELKSPWGPVSRMRFSPDGRLAAAIVSSGTLVQIWKAGTWEAAATVDADYPMTDAVFSPDGKLIAVVENFGNRISLWDTRSGKAVTALEGHTGRIFDVAFSPDGTSVVTASEDKDARVWEASGGLVVVLRGHRGIVTGARFSPDGHRVVTSSLDGTARVWEAAVLPRGAGLKGDPLDFDSAGFTRGGALVVAATDHRIAIWDAATGARKRVLEESEERIFDVAVDANGRFVGVVNYEGPARVWDVATGTPVAELRGHDQATGAAFTLDGTLLVTRGEDDSAVVWDVGTGKVLKKLPGRAARVRDDAFSPDGRHVVTAVPNAAVLWEVRTGQIVAEFPGPKDYALTAAAMSPDGRRVVTTAVDGIARLWDASTGALLLRLEGHTDTLTGAAFSPDGQLIVTIGLDRTARIWEAATGNPIAELRSGRDNWQDTAFHPKGTILVTRGRNNHLTIWDARTGTRLIELPEEFKERLGTTFSPDGKRLLVTERGGLPRIYICEECGPVDALLALARSRTTRQLTAEERETFLHEPRQ